MDIGHTRQLFSGIDRAATAHAATATPPARVWASATIRALVGLPSTTSSSRPKTGHELPARSKPPGLMGRPPVRGWAARIRDNN
jgi:hypothetical protein